MQQQRRRAEKLQRGSPQFESRAGEDAGGVGLEYAPVVRRAPSTAARRDGRAAPAAENTAVRMLHLDVAGRRVSRAPDARA